MTRQEAIDAMSSMDRYKQFVLGKPVDTDALFECYKTLRDLRNAKRDEFDKSSGRIAGVLGSSIKEMDKTLSQIEHDFPDYIKRYNTVRQ